ncbi:hypothetical protein [Micromonospora sp. NPDC023956]|uniref:hypothetical protein n=1 Tax=Micromonospora sp. NPDC023956 TaxID=3155722 RepID=UPI0033E3D2BA
MARLLVDLLAVRGRADKLPAEVEAGGAADRWLGLLVQQGQRERGTRIRRYGWDGAER